MIELVEFALFGFGCGLIAVLGLGKIGIWLDERREASRKQCGDGGRHHYGDGIPRLRYRLKHRTRRSSGNVYVPQQEYQYQCQHNGCVHSKNVWEQVSDASEDREDAHEALKASIGDSE
jgi:hypothetical protein